MENALITPSPALSAILFNASQGAIALAWQRKEASQYDACDELEEYVAHLDSVASVQRWFNAFKIGLTPPMDLLGAQASCQLHSDEIWNHLVQLHPSWKHAAFEVWQCLAIALVRYASDVRCLERFDALRAQTLDQQWTWTYAAQRANRLASMQYLWDKDIRPLESWVINWFHSRTSDRIREPSVLAAKADWDNWMANTILPALPHVPQYAQLYHYAAKEKRLSINWARVPRLKSLMPYLPQLHLAAAWHNDPCWLSVCEPENNAWRDYVALYRLLHPESFYKFAPEMARSARKAPLQDVWNMAYALGWDWPTLLAQVERLGRKEGSLILPIDFV